MVSAKGLPRRLGFFICYVNKSDSMKGWVATASIVIGQLHIIAIIGMLQSLDGSVMQAILSFASLAFFDIPIANPECLLVGLAGNLDSLLIYLVPAAVIGGFVFVWLVINWCALVPIPSSWTPLPTHRSSMLTSW